MVILVAYITFNLKKVEVKKTQLRAETIKVTNGYGYEILYEDKILVKQEVIPAIQGKRPFESEKDARLVADEVLKKITKKKAPFVTVAELNELRIKL